MMAELDQHLWDYYGQANEIAAGVKPKPEDFVEKPEPLKRYEQAAALGVPYVEGGLMDQPYIWMLEHGVIYNFLKQWNAIQAGNALQAAANQQSGG